MEVSKIDFTAAEMGYLWHIYRAQGMNYCILTYFDSICEDNEIKELIRSNMEVSEKYLREIETIFSKNDFPIPIGFTVESDVNFTGERLYTDPLILFYQWFVAKGNLNFGSIAINTIARDDVFYFFDGYISDSLKFLNHSRRLLLEKGLWIRAPYIPQPTKVEFVKKESFLNGWFGDTRPLIGVEIASLFYNIITNTLGESFLTSFIQVTDRTDVKNYFIRGKEIAMKHMEILSKTLKEEELPAPSTWNSGITASTAAPFSEKLMLSLVTFLNSQGLSNYGIAASTSARTDIGINFNRLAAEVAKFAEDGTSLLIENGWMEAPPHAPKRRK
ncbi:hypothetical protein J2S74_004223 [Evansella vedderi]|uniref:DUF3231 family protein n=1 Tax=Evansella vedderi TaxID=38282 RepID=A0ABT9ZZY5_9BACI|nr:DUF3231 family protein [Evansella vedderi]MDQ0256801.1 hypothetical protein [Evansella vedderi]